MRHCVTSRKVTGSIPDVTGIFHWHNPQAALWLLGSTPPLTTVNTRYASWGLKAAVAYCWQLYELHVPIVLKSGSIKFYLYPYLLWNIRNEKKPLRFSDAEVRKFHVICSLLYAVCCMLYVIYCMLYAVCYMLYSVCFRLDLRQNIQTVIFCTFIFNSKIVAVHSSKCWYVVGSLHGVTFQATSVMSVMLQRKSNWKLTIKD